MHPDQRQEVAMPRCMSFLKCPAVAAAEHAGTRAAVVL